MDDLLRTFGLAVNAVDAELDWALLGRSYCDGDGSEFFDDALRERIIDTGLMFVDDIARALDDAPGQSLYLGAEISEIPLVLAEHIVLGRRVEWLNIDDAPTRELVRAISAVNARLELDIPIPRVRAVTDVEPASCNHLWMVSVLTDPAGFPALHDALYERSGTELATARGSLDDDRARAEILTDAWLERATENFLLSTTDEEWTVVEPLLARRGWKVGQARGRRLSAIVGDRVRMRPVRRTG